MLDLDHLTITKTKPKPKRKLATVNTRIEITDTVADDDDADVTVAVAAHNSHRHMSHATYANRPTKKPASSNALPLTSSSPKQCTYKHLTCIQHCLWIYILIISFCLPKCKCKFLLFFFLFSRLFFFASCSNSHLLTSISIQEENTTNKMNKDKY